MKKQPNSDHCFVCGRLNPRGLYMAFYDDGKDEVWSDHVIPAEYQGYPRVVHGGVLASILDEIVARVSFIDNVHQFMMSARLDIKFRRPVPVEVPLRFVGRRLQMKERTGRADGSVFLPDGALATEATMTLAALPDVLRNPVAEIGWRIDP